MGRPRLEINWDDQPLGLTSDSGLARSLGCAVETVRAARMERCIPVFVGCFRVKRQTALDLKRFYPWATAEAVAHALKISPQTVRKVWRENGINTSRNWRTLQKEAEKRKAARHG